jgi:hypothetical protein
MFYIIHAIAGCLIGNYFNSVLLVIILAIISHFLLDIIPHWDGFSNKILFETKGRVDISKKIVYLEVFDSLIALALIAYFILLIPSKSIMILIGSIASLSPDIIKLGFLTPLKKNKFYMSYLQFHSKIQKEIDWKLGVFIQIIVLIILFLIFQEI